MSNSIKAVLINKLTESDNKRSRSVQTEVGPSEIGGCATRIWHRVNGTEPTNPNTLRLAAIMGTSIHNTIEEVFSDGEYLTETEVSHDGIMGHIDLIDPKNKTIWDWKTTTKNSLSYFPSQQQREQVQIYGYLANANGYKIEHVGLVAIARDGNEQDIVEHVEPYNENFALMAIQRYQTIREQFEPPAPEKDVEFCAKYCPFFGACTGKVVSSSADAITNDEIVTLVKEYKNLQSESKNIKSQLDAVKEALEGTQGTTPDGTTIKWSKVSGRTTIDEEAVYEALGFVPKKQGNDSYRLTVK